MVIRRHEGGTPLLASHFLALRRYGTAYLMVAPALVIVGLLFFYPLIKASILSFFKAYMLHSSGSDFLGFGNYKALFKDHHFLLTLENSVIWVVGSNICHATLGMSLALLMNKKLAFRGALRGILLIPWVTPIAVVGVLWKWIYSPVYGVLNQLMIQVGILGNPVSWLTSADTRWFAIVFANAWKAYGFMFICFLSGLQAIPTELFEAASMDGAGAFRRFGSITVPFLRSLITVVLLLGIAWTFNDVAMVWLLTQGGPGYDSMVFGTFVYQTAFGFFQFGYASAAAVIGFLVMVALSVFYIRTLEVE